MLKGVFVSLKCEINTLHKGHTAQVRFRVQENIWWTYETGSHWMILKVLNHHVPHKILFMVHLSTEIEFLFMAWKIKKRSWNGLKTFCQHSMYLFAIYKCSIINLVNFHPYAALKLLLWLLFFSFLLTARKVITRVTAEPQQHLVMHSCVKKKGI